jgi:hypothetical protein
VKRLSLLLSVIVAAPLLAAPATPTNLQVNCGSGAQANPKTCTNVNTPSFSWSSSTSFNAFQITVDTAPDFSACWLWFPPTISVSSTTSGSIVYPSTHTGSCSGNTATLGAQGPWVGARTFFWRVRVSDDGGSTFSPYATGTFSYENYPSPPSGVVVANGSGGGPQENYGDTSAGTVRNVTDSASLQSAVNAAAPGDVIKLGTGTYTAPSLTSAAAGTKAKPITITEQPGATATITSTLSLAKAYWVVDGLTFNNASACSLDFDSSYLLVKNSTFNGSGTCLHSDPAVIHIGGGDSNHLLNNVISISGSPSVIVQMHSGTDTLIRGNEITGPSPRAINTTGESGAGNETIVENFIHNISGANGVGVSFYYGMGEFFVARNVIYDISGGLAVRWSRGGWGTLRNNTIGRVGGTPMYCYVPNDGDGQAVVENDLCISTSVVWDSPATWWYRNHKHQWRNSNYSRTTGGAVDVAAGSCGTSGTTCIDLTNVTNSNPNLDAAGRPQSSSTALIDLGRVGAPVPVEDAASGSVGARTDIGRFEYGAKAITERGSYDYQAIVAGVNATPRISWTFVDPDNTFNSAGQTQSAYEVQIDTVNTFDSGGPWKPKCSSGKVATSSAFWDVPASCNLQVGATYYFRVRTYDNIAPTKPGLWTDYINAFTVGTSQSNLPPANVNNVRRTDDK